MNVPCYTYERFMSHIWLSHVTHTNESCYTYELEASSELRVVAVSCSVQQCIALPRMRKGTTRGLEWIVCCCSVLQCVAVYCSPTYAKKDSMRPRVNCVSLWCVAVCGSVLQSHVCEWAIDEASSDVTYEWVMSHMNESCHIRRSDGTYEWVMLHMNEWHVIWASHVSYEWVTAHTNESSPEYKSHTRTRVCHTGSYSRSNEASSHVTYECVMPHTNESCPPYERVMSHTTESCHNSRREAASVTSHMNESCHTWMSHVHM